MKDINPASLSKLLKLGDQPKRLVRMAIEIGTPIALGTDSGIAPHGTNAQEMVEYVEAGMTPVEALKTATVHAAAASGIKDRGALPPGMPEDVIGVGDDPDAELPAVTGVLCTIRPGQVSKHTRPAAKTYD